jgi:hypothetical protein
MSYGLYFLLTEIEYVSIFQTVLDRLEAVLIDKELFEPVAVAGGEIE